MFCHPIRPKLVLLGLFAHFGVFALVQTLLGVFKGFCRLTVEHAEMRKLESYLNPRQSQICFLVIVGFLTPSPARDIQMLNLQN